MVERAELLIRAFAHVGVIALVDEATGYQSERDKDALQEILNLYIGQELAKWAKRFPDAFYQEMFRLKGWAYNPNNSQRPHAMARLTIDLVFDRIGPGLSADLKKRRQELLEASGRKNAKLHQAMTQDIGHPALQHHLSGLIFLGKSFGDKDWGGFYAAVERVAPRYNRTMPLPLEPNDPSNEPQRPSAQLPSAELR
jgi:P63C domain